MKRICAWCNKELGSEKEGFPDGFVTHGICSLCVLKLTTSSPRSVGEILSLMEEPVFLIDAEGVVKAANRSGLKILGKEYPDIEDHLGGDAFECTYARNEGGCGQTVHCKTCAIRNIVMDTLKNGCGYANVPAFQSINTPEGPRIIKFRISTEKVGERILLRIDTVGQ